VQPRIDLVPRRRPNLVPRGRDYLIYARECRVGRIYEVTGNRPRWFWGIQGVFTSMDIGQLQGSASSLPQAMPLRRIHLTRASAKTWKMSARSSQARPWDLTANSCPLLKIGARTGSLVPQLSARRATSGHVKAFGVGALQSACARASCSPGTRLGDSIRG